MKRETCPKAGRRVLGLPTAVAIAALLLIILLKLASC